MPPAASATTASLVLTAVLLVLAAYFALRQWRDHRHRDPDLSEADADYFARQDVRRWLGSVVMVLLAAGIGFGTRINPRANPAARRLFGWVWMGVIVLLLIWLILALLDWRAITAYARRHRQALAHERFAAFEEERRKQAARGNGRGNPDGPISDVPRR